MVKDKTKLMFGVDDVQTNVSDYMFRTNTAALGGGDYVQ